MKKANYYLNENNEFVIENFHLSKPFSSFFPGIAGCWGIPIWAFYVNRGQAIASFGIRNKENPIMEFYPANKSYSHVSITGFRTFIKIYNKDKTIFYDAFNSSIYSGNFNMNNKMLITPYDLKIKETNHTLGLETSIEYFTIPNDNYGALARIVVIKNLTNKTINLEILDGIPQIIPYGFHNKFLKFMSRTVEAWIDIENLDNYAPYLRLKVDAADKPEVIHIKEGNFYLSFDEKGLIRPIVDPDVIFGTLKDFTYPILFLNDDIEKLRKKELTKNKIPCCMGYRKINLKASGSETIYTLVGNMDTMDKLNKNLKRISKKGYISRKQAENKQLILDLMSPSFTDSASREFDAYCGQNFLDNMLRGGYPLSIKYPKGQMNLHLFTRRHGDLERDYNNFLIEPTYFSQGNGNFRDVNQNRRNDIWFNPDIKEEIITSFFNLIQSDGYNPLVIKPENFAYKQRFKLLDKFFKKSDIPKLKLFLRHHFTIGKLFLFIEQNNINILEEREQFLYMILANSVKLQNAEHADGFWIDHWHYCLDLLESYNRLYPENLGKILFDKKEFTFFDSAKFIKPREERYILKNNYVFQVHGVEKNNEKAHLIKTRKDFSRLSRAKNGTGSIYKTTLLAKMLIVIANKFSNLDPFGIGVEMEADKPNWCDSLNGLPGLLGSSTCETFELKRWLLFLRDNVGAASGRENIRRREAAPTVKLPIEAYDLLVALDNLCKKTLNNYAFWDKSHSLKEEYRKNTLMGFSGVEKKITVDKLIDILNNFLQRINVGLKKAYDNKTKLPYSYFINKVTEYKILSNHQDKRLVKPLKFKQKPLPLCLEAIVHCLKITEDLNEAERIFKAVKKSELFDKKLKMYKICAPLHNMPLEIGRMRIFTPGWLENESIWLHMEYKYLLELLKCGLYDEFFQEAKNTLIPFQLPERYGRSILENSSFIVSSTFPKKELHGNGFVARLSGSTAEFIHIWLIMCAGIKPFYLDANNKLCLGLKPVLPSWLFKKDTFSFKFLNKTIVVYHNPKRKNTFGKGAPEIKQMKIKPFNKQAVTLNTSFIPAPFSYDARDGKIERIDIVLDKI